MDREKIEVTFSLSDLKQTKVYQEARAEGKAEGKAEGILLEKLKGVPGLLALGLSLGQIAGALGLEGALVERVAAGEEVEEIVREILG